MIAGSVKEREGYCEFGIASRYISKKEREKLIGRERYIQKRENN